MVAACEPIMPSPEIVLERFLQEKRRRGEQRFMHILGRLPVDDLPPLHLYRWLVEWMNRQLSDIGVNSTGGLELPPLHFDLVRAEGTVAAAHVFHVDELAFIVVTEPMVDEMARLATKFVGQNRCLLELQIAPDALPLEIAWFLVFLQFSFIASHEYSHLVRRHLEDTPRMPELGEVLTQAQEVEADGYGIVSHTHLFVHR